MNSPFQVCSTMHRDGSVVFIRKRAMEWRWVIYFEGGRKTEGEKAGLSEGERERGPGLCRGAKLLDATLLCTTRVNSPQMISNP